MATFMYRALPVHYELYGKGDPVLLIHGLGCSGDDWALQIAALKSVAHLIVPDLPGCGATPPPRSGYSIRGAATLLWALLDDLRVTRPNIVGFSMGGAIALEMALQRPARVAHLALINSLGSYHGNWHKWLYARMSAAMVRLLGMHDAAIISAAALFPKPSQGPLRERAVAEFTAVPAREYLQMANALEEWSITQELNQIKSRILIIAAEHDHTPLSEKLSLAKRLHANIAVVRGSRHGTPFDASDATNACLIALLRDQALPASDQLICDATVGGKYLKTIANGTSC